MGLWDSLSLKQIIRTAKLSSSLTPFEVVEPSPISPYKCHSTLHKVMSNVCKRLRKERITLAKVKKTDTQKSVRKIRPALSPEARENQLISLAVDLVEQRLLDGTASSQETTHFLKLGSSKHRLELEKLGEENKLLRAKTENLQSQKKTEEMFVEAINAFKRYSGQGDVNDETDEY